MQRRTGVAVAIAAPCIAAIVAVLGGSIDNSRTDGAGEQPEPAFARTLDEQLELLAQREEQTQTALSEVRQLIADDGWMNAHPWMFRSCEREAHSCYDIYTTAEIAQGDADSAIDASFSDELRDAGWRSVAKPPYCHGSNLQSFRNDDGQRLCVELDGETLSVALVSPHYWGDLFALRDAAHPDAAIFNPRSWDQSATYRWDEWQASVLTR